MPVDNSIQYNGYNSYRLTQNEIVASYMFGVQDMENITASFQAFCTSAQTAAVRAYLRYWDVNNAIVLTDNISFALASAMWEKKEYTSSVPAGAIKAQLFLTNPISTAWYMAQPKVEEGQVATPYAQNLAGQMTYITPNGVYTGTVRAEQIIITSGESLDDRFIAINQNQILLSQGLDTVNAKTTKITAAGVYTGEVHADQINAGTINAARIASGSITAEKIATGTITGDKIAGSTITGSKIAAGTITADKINVTNLYVDTVRGLSSPNNYARFFSDGATGQIRFYSDQSGTSVLRGAIQTWLTTAMTYSGDTSGVSMTILQHGSSRCMASQTLGTAYVQAGTRRLGVDATGFFKETNGVKTYF